MSTFELAIIGGGPAGLSAALTAGRARLRTVVVSAERPRHAVSAASHGYLTRDGVAPREFLEVARAELDGYESVRYVHVAAEGVAREGEAFVVALADGSQLRAGRVVLATGFEDRLDRLGLPGLEAVYGRSVFPCPFCDGYEHRDRRLAVFGALGVEPFVGVVRLWSEDVAVFTNGTALGRGARARLESRGVRVFEEPVVHLDSGGGRLRAVELAGGECVGRDAGLTFIGEDYAVPAARLDEALGVPRAANPWGVAVAEADEAGRTGVEGVYVVGDARIGFGSVVEAAAEGARCVRGIAHEVAAARWEAEP